MEQQPVALRFVEKFFPAATVAVVAGSTARGTRTATSDIDLLLVGPAEMFGDDKDSVAATYEFEGEIIEVFAYTLEGFERWARAGVREHRPVIVDMLQAGVPVRSEAPYQHLRVRWEPIMRLGPAPDAHELDLLRYAVTDLLDDLADATDPLEARLIASALFEKTSVLLLLAHHRWIGTGKYLARRLREWDAGRAEKLSAPFIHSDWSLFMDAVVAELDQLGGRLQAGFTR
jgi:predicted nucleotidyltransferase